MDYSAEPPYSALLDVRGTGPINAEPTAAALVEFNLTPEDLVYCRNHGPVREFDEDSYNLIIKGTSKGDFTLSMKDLKSKFSCVRVVATLQASFHEISANLNHNLPRPFSVPEFVEKKWDQLSQYMACHGRMV